VEVKPADMKRTIEETALLLALLLKRGGGTRGRVSEVTVRKLGNRSHLRSAFKEDLRKELDDLGLLFVEIERGGFGLQRHTTLNGAPALTAKRYLADDLRDLDKGRVDFDEIRQEVESESVQEEEDSGA
jgi:hypothetical protein